VDLRRRVLPFLVWSVAAAICVVVLVGRAHVEYIAWDPASGNDASARASSAPVPGAERPSGGAAAESFGVLASAGPAEPAGTPTPTQAQVGPTANADGIWWCRQADALTTSVSPPLLPNVDEDGAEPPRHLTPASECDPIATSTEPFVAEWTRPAGGKGELKP
jgi:hypothetical protein